MIKFEKALESEFNYEYTKNSVFLVRIGLILCIFLYAVYGVLDIWVVPFTKNLIWIIRFLIVIPFMFLSLLLTYHKNFHLFFQYLLSAVCIVAGIGIAAMIALSQSNEMGYYHYYAGLMLVIMSSYTLFRLRFFYAFISAAITTVAYELVLIFFQHAFAKENIVMFINNNFFFLSANVIGILASYTIENLHRKDYMTNSILISNSYVLEKQKEELKSQKEALQDAFEKLQKQETLIIQQEKLVVLGDITASVAHEISTPLMAITVGLEKFKRYFDFIRAEYSKFISINENTMDEYMQKVHDKYDKHFLTIFNALDRIRKQVTNMKSFIKFQEAIEDFNVNDEIELTLNIMNYKILSNMDLDIDLDKAIPSIKGNGAQMNQVFMNLIKNAVDAVRKDVPGKLAVKTYQDENSIYVSMSDNGKGIDNDHLPCLFAERFTTKKDGAGLGLSICRDIIEHHNGEIVVSSIVNEGTTFIIKLPKINQE